MEGLEKQLRFSSKKTITIASVFRNDLVCPPEAFEPLRLPMPGQREIKLVVGLNSLALLHRSLLLMFILYK